jgi:4-amino-4-deoxy-L-arabinose transferase-like glycosyltransferase
MPSFPHQSLLLREPTEVEDGSVPTPGPNDPWPPVVLRRSVDRRRRGAVAQVVGSPGLALLASFSILEGYRWFGVIAGGGSRPWAVVFAAGSLPVAAALTRRPGGRRRSVTDQLVVLAAAAAAAVTAVALVRHGPWVTDAIGVTDLALGAAALGALATGERRRLRGDGAP